MKAVLAHDDQRLPVVVMDWKANDSGALIVLFLPPAPRKMNEDRFT